MGVYKVIDDKPVRFDGNPKGINAGRIGFIIKGNYDASATYEFLDVVYYQNSSYVAKKTTTGNAPEEDNEFWHILAKGANDVSDTTLTFTEAADRVNVESGDKLSIFAGKVKRWFSSLGAAAFCGIANNDTTTEEGFALDARRGAAMRQEIDALNSACSRIGDKVNTKTYASFADMFANVGIGLHMFNAGEHSSAGELPANAIEWIYSCGLMLKRDPNTGTMLLFSRKNANVAINPIMGGQLGTWRIL